MYNNTKAVDLYGFVKTFRSLLIDKVLLIIIKFIKNKLPLNINTNTKTTLAFCFSPIKH